MKINPIIAIDSYKLGHMAMYPEGTQKIYWNLIPRSTKRTEDLFVPEFNDGKIVAFGMRVSVQEIHDAFETNFFNRALVEILEEFKEAILPFVGDNPIDKLIGNVTALHKLGYLPLVFKWLPEGTLVKAGIPLMTGYNTSDIDLSWLPQYLETFTSSEVWKRPTAATIARHYRLIAEHYAKETCDDMSHVPFQCHDFSCRGMSTFDDAIKTGMGHLTQFVGSDSVHSAFSIKQIYTSEALLACSVPATEHSVMMLGSSNETETETFKRLIKQFNKGIVSIVSDTWDFWDTITNKARELKDDILAREADSLGLSKVVFRPDTGNPADVICGFKIINNLEYLEDMDGLYDSSYWSGIVFESNGKYYAIDYTEKDDGFAYGVSPDYTKEIPEAEVKGAIECLWDIFGGTINSKGYKVLNPKVGLIYGDSITPHRANDIFQRLKAKGFASSNIVLGIGSYTYQYVTRDTLGFAIKATYAEINGKGYNVAKTPKTDSDKNSAKGMLMVYEEDGEIKCKQECTAEEEATGLLYIGYINGVFTEVKPSFDEIRARAQA